MTRPLAALRLSGAGLTLLLLANCGPRLTELDCMQRAMYFESNRSSRDGMVAVGSVVMNRVESGKYPRTVCGVVGQKKQFAPGVMTKRMKDNVPMLRDTAQSVLDGERHPAVGNALFFHTATYRPSYNNIQYVLTTGGNAFYERIDPALVTQRTPLPPMENITAYPHPTAQ